MEKNKIQSSMRNSQISKFENQLKKHCNIEYDIVGDEVVKSSINAVLIAFEEWYKEYQKDVKSKLKNLKNISSKDIPPEFNKIVNDNFWDLF